MKTSLAFFDKCCIAFWTADLDLAFATRNANLLPAGRTLVNVVCLSLCKHIFLEGKEAADLVGLVQVPLIFLRALVDVAGKHTVVRIDD